MSVSPKRTGRLVLLDPKKRRVMSEDEKFLMHKRRREAKGAVRRNWLSPGFLDQGYTSECVIHSFDDYLTSSPIRNPGFKAAQRRTAVYREVQTMDEWPGEGYDGTSVRAMMKWAKERGWIKDYHWAFEIQPIIDHLLVAGPVCLGTIWDDAMGEQDKEGYIFSTQDEADDMGHAWTAIGVDKEKVHRRTGEVGAFNCKTTWGDWGRRRNSRFWLTFKEMAKLIAMAGEAAVANEIKTGRQVAALVGTTDVG